MKEKGRKKFTEMAILLVSMLLLWSSTAFAATQTGSIEISLKDLDSPVSVRNGIELQLYKVGTVDDYDHPWFDDQYGKDEYPQTSEELDAAAREIAQEVKSTPDETQTTDKDGTATFSGLEKGIYLIKVPEGNAYGSVTPFLVQLPYYQEVDGQMEGPIYQVSAQPKAEAGEVPEASAGATITPSVTVTPTATATATATITNGSGTASSVYTTTAGTAGTTSTASNVKTGDETTWAREVYLAVMAAVTMVMSGLLFIDRRKHR
jgi:hypothetical protein